MTKPSSEFFKSSSIQISDERIEASQFSMAIFEHKARVQIWEGLTCTKCSVISGMQLSSITSKGGVACLYAKKVECMSSARPVWSV